MNIVFQSGSHQFKNESQDLPSGLQMKTETKQQQQSTYGGEREK